MTAAQPEDPLAPVRTALLDRARQHAADLLEAARGDAEAEVARAQQEAERLRSQARAEGEADAAAVLESARTTSRREARGIVLAAQREVFDDLHRRVRESVARLREDPGYRSLLHRLEARARAALGPDVLVAEAPEGGVVAEAQGRRFVCTLPDIAEETLARSESDLQELWS